MTWENVIHRLCRRKNRSHFGCEVFHRETHRRHQLACGKRVREYHRLMTFPQIQNGCGLMSSGTPKPAAGTTMQRAGLADVPRSPVGAGYDSPVCSTTGDAIDRIAAAIDQLASDARAPKGTAGEGELTTRVAALWRMVSDLDPELARRTQRYAAPEGGAPSS
jgi:hypothetical protein